MIALRPHCVLLYIFTCPKCRYEMHGDQDNQYIRVDAIAIWWQILDIFESIYAMARNVKKFDFKSKL